MDSHASGGADRVQLPEGVEVALRRLKPLSDPESSARPLQPGRTLLRKGQRFVKKGAALVADVELDRDVEIPLRDGTLLRGDIYRPAKADGPLPVILAFTPYGKSGGYWHLDRFPARAGVARSRLTGLQSFESPDPNDWCPHGFAVAVVDSRGMYASEGDHYWWGRQGGEDGYDVVEWLAQQSWSNGKVGMTGNSQLAMIQWTTAALRPPHLAAIAPWEGLSNHYYDNICAGGIPFPEFNEDVLVHKYGNGRIEDITGMLGEHPFYDEYWASKTPKIEDIAVPAYVVASITNPLHTQGTLDAFRRLGTSEKWLRVHRTMEWPDYYEERNVDDLRRFFDRYLRGTDNDWESTPPVRLSVIDLGGTDVVERPEQQWPPERVTYRELYLDGGQRTMSEYPATAAGEVTYDSSSTSGHAVFDYNVLVDTEIIGYPSLRLFVSAEEASDIDLFVRLEKVDKKGRRKYHLIMPPPMNLAPLKRVMVQLHERGRFEYNFVVYGGVTGRLRASRRELESGGWPAPLAPEPRPRHVRDLSVLPGEIVPVDIALWPASLLFRKGETLRLTVWGQDPRGGWWPGVDAPMTRNRGPVTIHTGTEHTSCLLLPTAPG